MTAAGASRDAGHTEPGRRHAPAHGSADRQPSETLAGTWTFIRLILRRDRVRIPLWFGLVFLLTLMTAASIATAFPSDQDRAVFTLFSNANPAQLLLLGQVHSSSVGGLAAWRVSASAVIGLGLASLSTVLRHTRREEEEGRRDLLGAAVLGRFAPLTAAVAVTLAANLLMGAATATALIATGLPAAGSWALGLQLTSYGWTMTGVGAITAQLTTGTRAASGWGVAVLVLLHLLRGAADAGGSEWLRWANPLGWSSLVNPYAENRIAPLLLVLAFVGAAVLLAFAAVRRRDVGDGILTDRPGPAAAAGWLHGAVPLMLRLNASLLLAWTTGAVALGLLMAGVAQAAVGQLTASPVFRELLAGSDPQHAFHSAVIGQMCMLLSAFGISAILRLHHEEASGRAELLLSTPLDRLRWAGAGFAVAAAGAVVVVAAFGTALGFASAALSGRPDDVGILLGAVLARLPAVWVMAALAAAFFGLAPRAAAPVAYGALALVFVLSIIVQLLQLDSDVLKLSPFVYTPALPAAAFDAGPLYVLTAVTALLAAAGMAGLRRRDML